MLDYTFLCVRFSETCLFAIKLFKAPLSNGKGWKSIVFANTLPHDFKNIRKNLICLIYLISYRNRKVFKRISNFLDIYIRKFKTFSVVHLMTLKKVYFILKTAEFYADFMSVEISEKSNTQKSYWQKNSAKQ